MPARFRERRRSGHGSDRQEQSIGLPLFDGHQETELERKIRTQPPLSLPRLYQQPNMTAAIVECCANAGLEEKEAASLLGIDPAQWSRIVRGTAHFPTNRYREFMRKIGNEGVLLYLAHQCGYGLVPLRTDHEEQIAERDARIAELEKKLENVADFMAGALRGSKK